MSINIYDYLEYQEYLKAIFLEKKAANVHFSHRNLARHLDLAAPGHILFVMQGKRKLTENLGLRIAQYLKLKKAETSYFIHLINYNNAKTVQQKQYAFELLQNTRRHTVSVVAPGNYAFYEKWYYSAIRAALDVVLFKDDYRMLANAIRPRITAKEALEAIELLKRLKFIKKDRDGYYRPAEISISAGDSWQSATIKNLHRQFIGLGSEALDRFQKTERDISCLTVTVSPASLERVRERIKNVRAEILEIAASEATPDRVLQCNFQVFPIVINDAEVLS